MSEKKKYKCMQYFFKCRDEKNTSFGFRRFRMSGIRTDNILGGDYLMTLAYSHLFENVSQPKNASCKILTYVLLDNVEIEPSDNLKATDFLVNR